MTPPTASPILPEAVLQSFRARASASATVSICDQCSRTSRVA